MASMVRGKRYLIQDAREALADLENAWAEHDYWWLYEQGYLTRSMMEALEALRERECADDAPAPSARLDETAHYRCEG
jgi:predicted lipid-binding transport protein (Tim44 family)